MAEELAVVGKRLPRKAAYRKVTGQLKYYSDRNIQNTLHMKILGSPHAHANIKSINTSKAEALKGVVAVLTYKDVPQTPLSFPDDIHILDDRVFYIGCEVAAVAAETEEIAEQATKLIEVEYELLPVVIDPEEAIQPGSPEVHPGTPNLIFGQPVVVQWGDVNTALAQADHVIEGDYFTQAQYICALENHGCTAYWDTDNNLTIWTGTQGVNAIREAFAYGLEMPMDKVRIIQCHMGGGFGGKNYTMRHIGQAALLSKKTGRPVKFVGSSEDEFQRCNTRHPYLFHIKSGVNNDGTITAMHVESTSNTGAYFTDALGAGAYVAIGSIDSYPCPNVYWKQNVTYTNCPNAGAYRGYGNLQGHHMLEQHIDVIAEKIGMDPLDFRIKNHMRAGQVYGAGLINGSEALDECIEKGAQAIGWDDKWKGLGKPYFSSGSIRRAVGMASCFHDGAYEKDSAIVKIEQDGTVQLLTGTADVGQGSDTVLSQICAETLKVAYEDISIISADTATTPWCTASVASSQTCTCGNAVRLACEDALKQLFEAASPILEANIGDLDAENGYIYSKKDPQTKISFTEVLQTISPPVVVAFGRWTAPSDYIINGFAAQYADVEVDVDTGGVRVLNMVLAHDVGKAVNMNTVENQIEGGAASQGMGMGVLEDFYIDEDSGKALNPNHLNYTIATALDAPEMQTILVEPIEPRGPFGAKGCSEICIVPTGPAIANAVYNAIGVRITEYPLSPDKVLKALGKA